MTVRFVATKSRWGDTHSERKSPPQCLTSWSVYSPMQELSDAIRTLEEQRNLIRSKAEIQITELNRSIAVLRANSGMPEDAEETPGPSLPKDGFKVPPNTYLGMKPALAMEMYLRSRAKDGAIPLGIVCGDITKGGAAMGMASHRERALILAARQRPKTFIYDEQSRTVKLASTAYDRPAAKSRGNHHTLAFDVRKKKSG